MFIISHNQILLGSGILSSTGNSLYFNGATIGGSSINNIYTYDSTGYTLQSADDKNILVFTGTGTSPVNLICPNNLSKGFKVTFIQECSGQIVPSGSSGSTMHSRDNYTGTIGVYSEGTLTITSNSAGNNAVYNLIGDLT